MKLYDHERHPLDIAAEEQAKEREKFEKSIDTIVARTRALPFIKWNIIVLYYEITKYLGEEYMYSNSKQKKARGWPNSLEECAAFLERYGVKDGDS